MTWLNELISYVVCFLLVLAIRLWVLSLVRVQGQSMMDTLRDRDWLFVWRLPYRFRAPQRQEIVICHFPTRHRSKTPRFIKALVPHPVRRWKRCPLIPQSFVKRVIAVPGDTLEVIDGVVHVNQRPLHEPYLTPEMNRFLRTRPPITLGRDEYFVMGDNRDHSNDSRRVGVLRRGDIRGRVVCILWPFKRMCKFY